jgi:hypothetical protein
MDHLRSNCCSSPLSHVPLCQAPIRRIDNSLHHRSNTMANTNAMKEFYTQSLFLTLGVMIGSTNVITTYLPVPYTAFACILLVLGLAWRASVSETNLNRKAIDIRIAGILSYMLCWAFIGSLWLSWIELITIYLQVNQFLRLLILFLPLVIFIVLGGLVYDSVKRWFNDFIN